MASESGEHWYITWDRHRYPRYFNTFIPRVGGGVVVNKYTTEWDGIFRKDWATHVSSKEYSRVSPRFQDILNRTSLRANTQNIHTMEMAGMDDIVYESLVHVRQSPEGWEHDNEWDVEDAGQPFQDFFEKSRLSAMQHAMAAWKTNPRKCTWGKCVALMVATKRAERRRKLVGFRCWLFNYFIDKVCLSRSPGWGAQAFRSGQMQFFAHGENGESRLVLVINPSGQRIYFEGEPSCERKVKVHIPGCQTSYFNGPRGEERLVFVMLQNGSTLHFQGPKDNERKIRADYADGTVEFFDGPMGCEYPVERRGIADAGIPDAEVSVQSATAEQLAAMAKENESLEENLATKDARIGELSTSLKEIQSNTEKLQLQLEKAGALQEKPESLLPDLEESDPPPLPPFPKKTRRGGAKKSVRKRLRKKAEEDRLKLEAIDEEEGEGSHEPLHDSSSGQVFEWMRSADVHPLQQDPRAYFQEDGSMNFPLPGSVFSFDDEPDNQFTYDGMNIVRPIQLSQQLLQADTNTDTDARNDAEPNALEELEELGTRMAVAASIAPTPSVALSDLEPGALTREGGGDDDAATSVATGLLCCICFANEREIALVPCGHRCLCKGCADRFPPGESLCPICRSEITETITVYL